MALLFTDLGLCKKSGRFWDHSSHSRPKLLTISPPPTCVPMGSSKGNLFVPKQKMCTVFTKKMWVMLCIAVIVASFAYLQPWKQCRVQVTHQDSWHGVLILAVQVTETIVRNDNACQFAIHSKMRIGITHKDQEMEGIIPPANLFLQWERNIWVMCNRGRHLLRVDQLWLDTFRLQKTILQIYLFWPFSSIVSWWLLMYLKHEILWQLLFLG